MAKNPHLYSALRGQDNWAQRRNDKAMNLAIQEKQLAREEKKVAQSQQAEEGVNKYFDEIANMDVLEQDQERINEVEKQARLNVVKGIAASNGDLTKYLSSGGISDMHDYKNSIMKSKEVKSASSNKVMLKNFLDAKSKGLFVHNVDVEVPLTNEDGTPKLNANGEAQFENQKMSFEDQMAKFRNGEITSLSFNGAEKPVKLDPFKFSQRPKDQTKPYSKDNVVTYSNAKSQAMWDGASEEYADRLAREYVDMVKAGGDSWKWGNKSEEDRLFLEAKTKKLRGGGGGKSGGGGIRTHNQRSPQLLAQAKSGGEYEEIMTPKERKWWTESKDIRYDKETNSYTPSEGLAGIEPSLNKDGKVVEYDLSNALSVKMSNKYVTKNGQVYVMATAIYDADEPHPKNPHNEGITGDNDLVDIETRHNWQHGNAEEYGILPEDGGRDVWQGQVLIPITKELSSGVYNQQFNTNVGNKSNVDGAYGSATNQYYGGMVSGTMEEARQMYPGYTDEQIIYALRKNSN